MELFITNLDAKSSGGKLQESLTPLLTPFDIHVFDVQKATGKTFANLTIADLPKAQRVLAAANQNPTFLCSPSGRRASFHVSRRPVDKFRLKALVHEDRNRNSLKAWQKSAADATLAQDGAHTDRLQIKTLRCGQWEHKHGVVAFQPYFEVACSGRFKRNGRTFVIILDKIEGREYELTFEHSDIQSIAQGKERKLDTLFITLVVPPMIVGDRCAIGTQETLDAAFGDLFVGSMGTSKLRYGAMPGQQLLVAGGCLTYSVVFSEASPGFLQRIRHMASREIPISVLPPAKLHVLPTDNYMDQLSKLNTLTIQLQCSFAWKFQLHALWANGILAPVEIVQLLPVMLTLRNDLGEAALLKALQRLLLHLAPQDASADAEKGGVVGFKAALHQHASFLFEEDEDLHESTRDEMLIHRVTVTPTGNNLSGPEMTAANRVLRKYREHSQCFIRVCFSDEDGERLQFDRDYSNEYIYRGRFLSVLQKGLDVAGQHFDFLGFSHSSLRAHTCWFMRPFIHEGSLLFAPRLISQLGDFSLIRCPAKCAARIGQAFSETTAAVTIDPDSVREIEDVNSGQYIFTDGCGTMSPSTWRLLRGRYSKANQPTSYQIRYKGAKGMLTLDARLEGQQICLRPSMIKFTGSPSDDLEICGTNAQPLPFKLNRQLIKILEDLGVPSESFVTLQEQAIKRLRITASSRTAAIDFVVRNFSDSSSGLPRLLKNLQRLGVDVMEDEFLRDVLGALLQVQLREIKYRSRILVPDAYTLYGISDETGFLEENEVFVTWLDADKKKDVCLNGRVAVTRSPALHPGDIQMVDAVAPPHESILWKLHNCVVFSQKGARDLPSMLSGGDLDGDLFNVIFDDNLMPSKVASPAAYTPVKALDTGRPVNTEDMTAFFVDFMENDVLGRVASLHQVLADKEAEGTFSSDCVLLAELHSTAVDFSKSGIKVNVQRIPRGTNLRPDFMSPSASVKVEKGITRNQAEDKPDSKGRYRYYESEKVLGELYRAIDEDIFFDSLEDDTSSLFSKDASNDVLGEVLKWVRRFVDDGRLGQYLATAREVREYYESNMLEIMHGYAVRRTEHLTEKEVFIGTILGRSGARSKSEREQSDYMKTRFNRDLGDIRGWMEQQVPDDDGGFDFISLAVACLYVAVAEESEIDAKLSSFGWFAAGLVVPDLVKEQEGSVLSI